MPNVWVKYQNRDPEPVPIDGLEIAAFLKPRIVEELRLDMAPSLLTLHDKDETTHHRGDKPVRELLQGNSFTNYILAKDVPATVSAAGPAPLSILDRQKTPCKIDFYNEISTATERDGWILFAHCIPSSELKRLHVRKSYQCIAESIQSGIQKAIITGTPGIGKSLFLIYLLWKLVKAKERVLIVYSPDVIYYDGKGGTFEFDEIPSPVDHEFWTKDLWCLFDAKQKASKDLDFPYNTCRTVLSTSPRRDMVNDYKKPFPTAKFFYMPVWSAGEIETIAPYFPDTQNWQERFEALGGIPRFVFEVTNSDPLVLLRAACRQCKLEDCIKMIGIDSEITEKTKVVHTLIHMKSEAPSFTQSSVGYASEKALEIIVEIKGKEAMRNMRALLEAAEGNPLTAALCGYIFEPYAVELLEKGGVFQCRQLVHGNKKKKPAETKLTIPQSTPAKLVVDKMDCNQEPNRLHVPKNKNYTALDAWIPAIGGFQMTVGKKHDLKCDAEVMERDFLPGANKVYWLLPPLYFPTFTKKSPQDIDQYALKIPYPSSED